MASWASRRETSEWYAASEYILEHHPITEQAVPGIGKGRRPVFLEHQMTDPGEAVAGDRRGQEPPVVAASRRVDQDEYHAAGADEMQAPANRVAMFGEIERIEVREVFVALCHI